METNGASDGGSRYVGRDAAPEEGMRVCMAPEFAGKVCLWTVNPAARGSGVSGSARRSFQHDVLQSTLVTGVSFLISNQGLGTIVALLENASSVVGSRRLNVHGWLEIIGAYVQRRGIF